MTCKSLSNVVSKYTSGGEEVPYPFGRQNRDQRCQKVSVGQGEENEETRKKEQQFRVYYCGP